jgi:hypothetical protein
LALNCDILDESPGDLLKLLYLQALPAMVARNAAFPLAQQSPDHMGSILAFSAGLA